MADLNKVFLIGNLTRDPVLTQTVKGNDVCVFGLAINSSFKSQDGSVKDEVCFVDLVTWGRQAQNCKEYLARGSSVFVEGRMMYQAWETKDGDKRNRLRVGCERVQFLGKRPAAPSVDSAKQPPPAFVPQDQKSAPAAPHRAAPQAPGPMSNDELQLSDDMPF